MDSVISVKNLHKTYGKTVAVDDISFDVRRGEIFGILGPNGAGKTTTVEILQGLRSRSGGKLEVLGLDPARDSDKLRPRMGSQLQSSALPERLRVGEAIRLFAKLHREPVNVEATLAAWYLGRLRKRPFGALSGGERQRLFLALALLGDPEVVFLDELTTGLDPTARRATWNFVRKVRDNGATVVLVTHFMEEADALCDRVGVVDGGRLVACDTPRALTVEAGGGVEVMFTANGHDPRHLLTVPGVESVRFDDGQVSITGRSPAPVSVAVALAEHGVTPNDYRTRYPNLEDVFLALTGRRLSEGEH